MTLTNSEWIQLSFGVTLAAKFAVVSLEPEIEPQTRELRQRLNIDNVLRHLALRIGSLVGRSGIGDRKNDIFFHYESRVRKIEKWYQWMMKATGAERPKHHSIELQASASSLQQKSRSHLQGHRTLTSATGSDVPVSVAFSHQKPQSKAPLSTFVQGSLQPMPDQDSLDQTPTTSVGMALLSTYQQYGSVPTLAFPDLMNAAGWDTMFTIPMEHDPIVLDVNQGYDVGMASPPRDTSSTFNSPQRNEM